LSDQAIEPGTAAADLDDAAVLVSHESQARSHTFQALSHPGFRRYFLGQGISLIGTWLQAAAVRWVVFDRTGSEFLLGVVETANLMPGLLVGVFAGVVADRVAPRRMILLMELVQMGLAWSLAALAGLDAAGFWPMVLIVAAARVSTTFELPSRQVFFHDLVGREALPNAIALNSGLFNATRVIGPVLAGISLSTLGAPACFALNGLSYLAAIMSVFSIRLPAREGEEVRTKSRLAELLGGFGFLAGQRRLLWHFLLMGYFGVAGMGFEAMIPAYTRKIARTGLEGYSLMLASLGLGATAGALTVARLSRTERKDALALGGLLVFALSLALALVPAWMPSGWPGIARVVVAMICLFGTGFGASLFYSSTQALVQLAVPHHLRGRVGGVWMMVFSGTVPLGALLTGRAATAWGVTPAMAVSALLCMVAAVAVAASGVLHQRDDPAAGG
jgi:predicted MFS family arabinose efflux permease